MATLEPQWILTYCPWAVEANGLHTRITVINYQYSNTFGHGGDHHFDFRLFVRSGTGNLLVDRLIGVLGPNQVWQGELAELLAGSGQTVLPDGNVTLAARPAHSDEVNTMRIPQFEIDYYTDTGQWESVHSKGFNPQYWYPNEFAFARVLESPVHASYLAIQNFSTDTEARPDLFLLRPDGDRRPSAKPLVLAPGGSACAAIDDLFPGSAAYLDNRPGALVVKPAGSRVLPYLFIRHRATGAWSADHYSMPV